MAYYPQYASNKAALYRDYVPWHTPTDHYSDMTSGSYLSTDTYRSQPVTEYVTEYSEPASERSGQTIISTYDTKPGGGGSGWGCPCCSPRTCCLLTAGILGMLLPLGILLGALLPAILNQEDGVAGGGVKCGLTLTCPLNSRCVVTSGVPSCECVSGYRKTDNGFCVEGSASDVTDHCENKPCQNGGVCNSFDSGFTCNCPIQLVGIRCEEERTSCTDRPCLNGGDCTVTGDKTFSCNCTDSYTGDTCEQKIDKCATNPCKNGGVCTDTAYADVLCECTEGFAGHRCENEVPVST